MPATVDNPIFDQLNEQQKAAVRTLKGPMLILAGAGSGKTRALTHRIANLMANGVRPWNILAVTFTNKAANEMKERVKNLLKVLSADGTEPTHLPMMGTFHSICVRMLRRDIERLGRDRNFVMYDSDDQEKLMQIVLKDLHIPPEDLKPRTALSAIGGFKAEALSIHDVQSQATTYYAERLANVYARYQSRLRGANALDFDDLILETVRLLHDHPDVRDRYQETWQHLHVDEYQDTNHAQYLFLRLLAEKYRNVCVIGDPDQSIYAFRGADIRNILQFKDEYPDAVTIKLERNYRSTQPILDAADRVIAANSHRPEKKMWTERKGGAKVVLREVTDEKREAEEAVEIARKCKREGMNLREQVILYRTNAQSRVIEEACLRLGVPYRILGGIKFYARKEVKDILAYLFTILNPNDTLSLLRIINIPSRKIGLTTIARLQVYCNERAVPLFEALTNIDEVEELNTPTKGRLKEFASFIQKCQEQAKTHVVSELTDNLLQAINMEKWLNDGTIEGESRWENVRELQSVAHKYDRLDPPTSLTSFLEEVALVSEVDKLDVHGEDALTLMTLHLCKGLEFRSVSIVGCEEGIFPHSASSLDRSQLEEERRLMYVGMTRAKDHLHLMHARSRILWGNVQANARSRFLDDLPHDEIEVHSDDVMSKYAWLSSATGGKIGLGQPWKASRSRTSGNEFNQDLATQFCFGPKGDDVRQNAVDLLEDVIENTRIQHRSFGEGTIVKRQGDIAEIHFDSGMVKKFALSIAPIQKIGD